jgi:RNA polymerase-binding transcription factor DksA
MLILHLPQGLSKETFVENLKTELKKRSGAKKIALHRQLTQIQNGSYTICTGSCGKPHLYPWENIMQIK